jgi:hypothetical protein
MSSNRITVLILAVAAVAIVAVLTAGGGFNLPSLPSLPSLGSGDDSEQVADASGELKQQDSSDSPEQGDPAEPKQPELPQNLDDVRGTAPYALTRPSNLRRALRVLDHRRRKVGGVFDGLRIAPGRIDAMIIHPDDRRTNLQIRPDLVISFESTYDFPTEAGFRKGGLRARDVPVNQVRRLLRAIDKQRKDSAARDVDYVVVDKDIIDFRVEVMAYMRIRTARPRYWRLEGGTATAFG